MNMWEVGFWGCIALIVYPYFLYPLWMALLSRLRPRPVRRRPVRFSVSIVIAAHNEQLGIERRIQEFLGLLERSQIRGELLVVSDGSTDDTATVVRLYTKHTVRLLELPERVGKAEALSRAAALAGNEILIFADVRQTWAEDALVRLLENFADPQVGAVSGDLEVVSGPGKMAGVGLYWRYEKWLRRLESSTGSQVGVTGAIAACRRVCFRPIPQGTLLDDVYWPLQVAMQGYRVVHDSRAVAFDRLPTRARDEFRRKVRTLAGNLQLVARLPSALLPWKNPVWFALLSHKLARMVVPWALIGLLVCSVLADGWFYEAALYVQLLGYGLGLLGLFGPPMGKVPAAAASFLVLNSAAWVAFWVYFSGTASHSWKKIHYTNRQDNRDSITRPGPWNAASGGDNAVASATNTLQN